jgi:hypothetical protein
MTIKQILVIFWFHSCENMRVKQIAKEIKKRGGTKRIWEREGKMHMGGRGERERGTEVMTYRKRKREKETERKRDRDR